MARTELHLLRSRELVTKELWQGVDEAKKLLDAEVDFLDFLAYFIEVEEWTAFYSYLLKRSFDDDENEHYLEFVKAFHSAKKNYGIDYTEKIAAYKELLELRIIVLKRIIRRLSLIPELNVTSTNSTGDRAATNSCFIVHGHNHLRMHEVTRFLENDLKKNAVILHEKASQGQTLIEKFEKHSGVDFAVALWTADDYGNATSKIDKPNVRARQNVVFETGFFNGRLGRSRVVVLYEKGVELPSDYSGVVFIPFDGNWKDGLRREVLAIYETTRI